MTDIQFSGEAFEVLKSLAKGPGSVPASRAWDEIAAVRFIMGDHVHTHITQRGKSFITKLIANWKSARWMAGE
jgi:hypothetical protein